MAAIATPDISRDIQREMRKFPEIAEEAHKFAILRTSRTVFSRCAREIAKRGRVKTGIIRKRGSNSPLRKNKHGRILRFGMDPIPLAITGPKGKPPTQRSNGVRSSGRHYPQGFVAKARFGKRPAGKGVFRREGGARGPLDEIKIPIQSETVAAVNETARRVMDGEFEKHMKNQLERLIARRLRKRQQKVINIVLG